MVPPTHNPVAQGPHTQPTYGGLLALATAAASTAQLTAVGAFDDAQDAAAAVGDYERYLAVAGHHLTALLSPKPTAQPRPAARPPHLAETLVALNSERHGGNAWTRAGDLLGVAHDLLATHVGLLGEFRTSEAVVLGDAEVQTAAVARASQLVVAPLTVGHDLVERARRIQPRTDPPLPHGTAVHVRHTVERLGRLVTATPATAVSDPSLLAELDDLVPIQSRVGVGTPRPDSDDALSALRTLRQLLYRQGNGLEPANAHSLQGLCGLAVTTCTAAATTLPYVATPLGRVNRAAAVDHLRAAAVRWGELGSHFYPHIQGLTKAPAIYRDVVLRLSGQARYGGEVNQAILSSLPRLATPAADTVRTLGDRGELVTPTRAPAQITVGWRPLTPKRSHELFQAFLDAGSATRNAHDACRRTSGHRPPAEAIVDVPQQRRALRTSVSR